MKKIFVTFQKAGIHKYPAAAHDPKLSDVSYLGSPHRHLFKFRVTIQVFHDDREIEFHQFLNYVEGMYHTGTLSLDHRSCEMIADELAFTLRKRYPNRWMQIEVSEDGECGAVIDYEPATAWDGEEGV
ncbi:hypothetical protein FDI24_gp125 [Acidovorax phage ACP17]|uniref:Uncharacterized protein n=1 Tax=Acidovorax phage ACP17 TaxID=2010329 RepID=A0A218M2Y7_9CAUD|nr:hypothetical protein FDI24_gp125 [Acidovorax phage ACP17]ASD50405.1 hypothetical protein [Acidovorax phage ACP17]